jgi:NADH:ubiquinone oxidoreductase subunit 4 (subunit M)
MLGTQLERLVVALLMIVVLLLLGLYPQAVLPRQR